MSREKLDALLAGRPRPSGSMCMACLHRESSCAHLPFSDMPVMRRDKDGTPVVRCTQFVQPSPAGRTSKGQP